MIISVLNQKGGVGKTTLAINLARYFTIKGDKTILIDSDIQGTAMNWHNESEGNLLETVCYHKPTLHKDVQKYSHYDWIFIDGVPQISNMSIAAITCSDMVLVPVQPSPYDIWATIDIVRMIKERQEIADGHPQAFFVVSRKIVNTNIGKEISFELEKLGLPVFKNGTCQRVIYSHCASIGQTVMEGKNEAANEIKLIATELEEYINDGNKRNKLKH